MSCRADDATAETTRTPVPSGWDASQIPSLQGKLAIVTGANSGIGFVTALELARKGAHVVLACRNEQKGTDAAQKIRDELTVDNMETTKVEFMQLDVSDLRSVKRFADTFKAKHDRLDLLINNAGVMAVPYSLTVDGVESQFATNHLGHFALTAQLFELLTKSAPAARVVNVSSVMHRFANLKEDEIVTSEKNYRPLSAYCNSKLCNLLFSFELNKSLRASAAKDNASPEVTVATCHPGYTATNLLGPPGETPSWIGRAFWSFANKVSIGQAAETGALPTLYAATAPGVQSGDYYGPKWCFGLFGKPVLEEPSKQSKSKALAAKLWEESERLANSLASTTRLVQEPHEIHFGGPQQPISKYHGGHLDVINYIHEQGYNFTYMFDLGADKAVGAGCLETIRWLHENNLSYGSRNSFEVAAEHGYTEIAHWLVKSTPNKPHLDRAIQTAAKNGHLETVQLLQEFASLDCCENALPDAAMNGHFEVVQLACCQHA